MKLIIIPIIALSFTLSLISTYYLLNRLNDKAVLGVDTEIDNIDPSPKPTNIPTPTNTPTTTPTNTPPPTPTIIPTPTNTPTPVPPPTPITAPSNLENLFNQYATQYGVDAQLLKRIANCESEFNQMAENGIYLGLFQFNPDIWIRYRTEMGHDPNPDLRADPNESIKTASYLIGQGKLFFWPNCTD